MNGTLKYYMTVEIVESLIAAIEKSITDKDKGQALHYRCAKIKEATKRAIATQYNCLTPKNMKLIHRKLRKFEKTSDIAGEYEVSVIISFCLAISEPVFKKCNSNKKEVVDVIIRRLMWLLTHKEIDPRIDQTSHYDQAATLQDSWEAVINE